ncbi:MAG: GntR family transcriptional regulator [Chloroflexi bacterium]|nr:GntR family transcriptional regulator [Chloroflexota bacterium]
MTSPLSERAYKSIKNDIITCTLRAGEQIAQSQLAERYQIGTTPIREALQRLVQDGFVQSIPRFGYVVSRISLSDVHEIYECRLILEPAAAYLAATRANDAQLSEIVRTADFQYTYQGCEISSDIHVHNAEFHRAIAAASNNGRLFDQISRVLDEMTRIFFLGIDLSGNAEQMHNKHLSLVEAISDRNPEQAKQIMEEELAYSKHAVLDVLVYRLANIEHAIQI